MAATLLDLSSPFVQAVWAIVDEDRGHDHAVDVLIAAERRHGVRIVREDVVGSLAATWVPAGPTRLTIRQFRELMAAYPDPAAYQPRWAACYRVGGDEATPDAPLFAFLCETSLLLGGTDFAGDHWIEFRGGAIGSWTQRAWGEALARWARTCDWRPDRRSLWAGDMGYAFFAFYLHHEVDRYEAWCAAVLEVLRRKCERQLDEVGP